MSLVAAKLYGNVRARRQAAVERELDAELAQVTLKSAKADLRVGTGASRMFCGTVDWAHLSGLVREAAQAAFPPPTRFTKGGSALPWNIPNLVNGGVTSGYPRWVSRDERDRVVEAVQRFCGWLKAAATLPGLRRGVLATQSWRGMHSHRTRVNLWEVARRRPSPGQLERALWATKERADAIVAAFVPGGRASWAALMQAVAFGPRQTGKAAVMAAAMTLCPNGHVRLYRDARDLLAALAAAKVPQGDQLRTESPRLVVEDVEVYDMFGNSSEGRRSRRPRFGFECSLLLRRKADGAEWIGTGWGGANLRDWTIRNAMSLARESWAGKKKAA